MVCVFAFIESNSLCGWFLISKSDNLDLDELKYFTNFYGKENIRLRCGDYSFQDYGFYPDNEFDYL